MELGAESDDRAATWMETFARCCQSSSEDQRSAVAASVGIGGDDGLQPLCRGMEPLGFPRYWR